MHVADAELLALEVFDLGADDLVLDREDADPLLRLVRIAHQLVVPLHLAHVERDLLGRLEADDLRELLLLHRRQRHEPRKAVLARHRNDQRVVVRIVALGELPQRDRDQLIPLGRTDAAARKDLVVRDMIEADDLDHVPHRHEMQGLERVIAQINRPNRIRCCCHDIPPAYRVASRLLAL